MTRAYAATSPIPTSASIGMTDRRSRAMPLKEKDEALAEAKKSLARLKEKRYYCLKEIERQRFNIRQECRAKLHELEEKSKKWLREIDAEIAAAKDVVNPRRRG